MGESLTNLLTEQGGLRTAYVTQTGNKTAKPLSVGAFFISSSRSLTIWNPQQGEGELWQNLIAVWVI